MHLHQYLAAGCGHRQEISGIWSLGIKRETLGGRRAHSLWNQTHQDDGTTCCQRLLCFSPCLLPRAATKTSTFLEFYCASACLLGNRVFPDSRLSLPLGGARWSALVPQSCTNKRPEFSRPTQTELVRAVFMWSRFCSDKRVASESHK